MSISVHMEDSASLPRVFGRYLLVQRLSSGGMGEIFLAKHGLSGFEKLCVIKKILPRLSADEHFISRFVDEAQVAIHLQHANIAQVFEVGRVGDEYFLSLEYIEGRDLRRSLQILAERNQRFPLDLALLIARDLVNGLAYAHRRTGPDGEPLGVVHCDISPPNVLVSFEGEIKVIDFGIAKSAVRGTASDPKMGFGKFGYMAPEQLVRGGEVDHRADIYAAGTVLFELLTGTRLYTVGQNPDYRELAKKVIHGEHPKPSDLDPELSDFDDLVLRAVATRAKHRFQSAAEFRDAIQQALVSVNPLVSSDALGLFMRELFAEEMEADERLQAQVREADLSAWQAQLSRNASSTVSFALVPGDAADAPGDAADGPAASPPAAMGHGAPAAHLSSGHPRAKNWREVPPHGGEYAIPTEPAGPRSGRRSTAWIVVAALTSLIGGTVVGLVANNDRSSRGEERAAPPALHTGQEPGDTPDETPRPSGAVAPTPTVAPLDTSALAEPPSTPAQQRSDEPEPEPKRQAKRPQRSRSSSRRKKKPRRRAPRPAPPPVADEPPPAEPELTRSEVKKLFRAVNKEYQSFQKSYGARLADRWADLVHAIQYAQSPDKLRRVADQLRAFRAEMRQIKGAD